MCAFIASVSILDRHKQPFFFAGSANPSRLRPGPRRHHPAAAVGGGSIPLSHHLPAWWGQSCMGSSQLHCCRGPPGQAQSTASHAWHTCPYSGSGTSKWHDCQRSHTTGPSGRPHQGDSSCERSRPHHLPYPLAARSSAAAPLSRATADRQGAFITDQETTTGATTSTAAAAAASTTATAAPPTTTPACSTSSTPAATVSPHTRGGGGRG